MCEQTCPLEENSFKAITFPFGKTAVGADAARAGAIVTLTADEVGRLPNTLLFRLNNGL
jgi:hypothetical protein